MNLTVRDANSQLQTVSVVAPATFSDYSGAIQNIDEPQVVSAANPGRSGFLFQNTSPNPMKINTTSGDPTQPASSTNTGSWVIGAYEFFPPYGYGTSQLQITVTTLNGAVGDTFTYQEW